MSQPGYGNKEGFLIIVVYWRQMNQLDNVLLPASLTDDQMNDLISDLQILIRQPSISATNQGLEECSILLSNMMKNAGIKTDLLFLDLEEQIESRTINRIPPIVYGEVK